MINLYEETDEFLANAGFTWDDVEFIGSKDRIYSCTVEEFKLLANHEYDAGYGAQQVASDLIINLKNGDHIYRYEYDGSERWTRYINYPPNPNPRKINKLIGGVWDTVESLQAMYEKEINNG